MDPLAILDEVKITYSAIQLIIENIKDDHKIKSILLFLNTSKYKILIKLEQLKFINLESLNFNDDCFYLWNKFKERNSFLIIDM